MEKKRPVIEHMEISGYKSIQHADLSLGKVNVLIGANGTGKSNFVSYLSLLSLVLKSWLDDFVQSLGGGNALLYLGAKNTRHISSALRVATVAGVGTLYQRLTFKPPDSLSCGPTHAPSFTSGDQSHILNVDGLCTIVKHSGEGHPGLLILETLKSRVGTYHFHDTSPESPIRTSAYVEDNQFLHSEGGNLAAFLYGIWKTDMRRYQRIVRTVQQVTPALQEFVLEPGRQDPTRILLNWRQRGSEYLFGPHQLSDGTLRLTALTALLLAPPGNCPDIIVIDEPELGLHPAALNLLSGLIRKASHESQVIVATQSAALLDTFAPEDVIVAEHDGKRSTFRRLETPILKEWLAEYTLGQLWEKNVFGGGPF
jgi:predicted ATPase